MRKTWGKIVDRALISCGQCNIFYTHLVRCGIVRCINAVGFTNTSYVVFLGFYTDIFTKLDLFWGGFYTKFLTTNNNNYFI
jgi:hypothetical protein